MAYCRTNCVCLSTIIGIVAGAIFGVLYAFGFVTAVTTFWAYLAIGVLSVLLFPVYAAASGNDNGCFCSYRKLLFVTAIGTVLASSVGLIVALAASTVVVAIFLGLATLFSVALLVATLCFANCLCRCA